MKSHGAVKGSTKISPAESDNSNDNGRMNDSQSTPFTAARVFPSNEITPAKPILTSGLHTSAGQPTTENRPARHAAGGKSLNFQPNMPIIEAGNTISTSQQRTLV